MTSHLIEASARLRHETNRTYTVIVMGPDGEVEVGAAQRLEDAGPVAKAGAARLFGREEHEVAIVDISVPRPPYGRDGQLVRIVHGDKEDLGALGKAEWFPPEGAWWVTCAGTGTGLYAGESLDFQPIIGSEEQATLDVYLARSPSGAGFD